MVLLLSLDCWDLHVCRFGLPAVLAERYRSGM